MARKRSAKSAANRQKPRSGGKRGAGRGSKAQKYRSAQATQKSDALEIEPGTFAEDDPKQVALSLKRSVERSTRRHAGPYRSAMARLTLFINRAGRNLSEGRRRILETAKIELRRVFGRG